MGKQSLKIMDNTIGGACGETWRTPIKRHRLFLRTRSLVNASAAYV